MPHILLVTAVRVHMFLWGQTAYIIRQRCSLQAYVSIQLAVTVVSVRDYVAVE